MTFLKRNPIIAGGAALVIVVFVVAYFTTRSDDSFSPSSSAATCLPYPASDLNGSTIFEGIKVQAAAAVDTGAVSLGRKVFALAVRTSGGQVLWFGKESATSDPTKPGVFVSQNAAAERATGVQSTTPFGDLVSDEDLQAAEECLS